MGKPHSKTHDSDRDEQPQKNEHNLNDYFVKNSAENEVLHKEIEKLRREYQQTPEMFLLNQLLFSVMFFRNYDQELAECRIPTHPDANIGVEKLSLTEDLFLTCLKPDDALSLVNKHVQFRATHGVDKGKDKPLVSNRIFVIHENMNIVSDANYHYANIDKPSLTAQVVEKHRKGYVRLKYIEDLKFKNSVTSTSSMCTSDTSSSDDRSETYGRITEARTIKPMPKPITRPGKLKKTLYSTTEVRRRNKNVGEHDKELYYYEYYVNSKDMMKDFRKNWPDIAQLLKLDGDENEAGFNSYSIFCRSKARDDMWEIIPAVQLPTGAYEYFLKIKSAKTNGQTPKYIFPTKEMLNDIADMDRLAIPRGFISKYKDEINRNCDLEWELAHPKAEKYLQQHLTHTHVRTLLLMLVVLKTFVEPRTKTQGVTIRHLVIHLFWELQKELVINETRMGTRLVKMINAFCQKLSTSVLQDYFVEERNHFENIPSHHIRFALAEFSRTRDKPLLSFMTALRNLKYTHEEFPALDIKKLHWILTTSNKPGQVNRYPEPRKSVLDWETIKRFNIMEARKKQAMAQNQAQAQAQAQNLKPQDKERKVSVESILESNLKLEVKEDFINLKRNKDILEFFIQHYIKMATSLNEFGNLKQAFSYLRQADLLTYLFHYSNEGLTSKTQAEIKKLRKSFEEDTEKRSLCEVEQRLRANEGPKLPERSPSVHIPQIRVINQNMMDLNKVQQQHQSGEHRNKLLRKRRESESNIKSDTDSDSEQSDTSDLSKQRHLADDKPVRVLRKRKESERSDKSNTSVKENERKPRKTVNFSSEVIVGVVDNNVNPNKVEKSALVTDPPRTQHFNHLNANVIVRHVSHDDSSDKSTTSEEEDLSGLDEILSEDEDPRATVIQVMNPINEESRERKISKILLDYNPEDTFT